MAHSSALPSNVARPKPTKRKRRKVIPFRFGKERLRNLIVESTELFRESIAEGDKELVRAIHLRARNLGTAPQRESHYDLWQTYRDCFIDGCDIEPTHIRPVLKLVSPRSKWEDLFRIVRWTWSMPYSAGYGRRLRFVVWDVHHGAVMGIIGLQSPPVDLSARDGLFEYPSRQKVDLINRTMDAYTIGAVPPYSNLLGGKLVAGLVASNEIRQAYWAEYAGKRTLMNGKRIEQPLVAVTTTSAFGRSSIYNRLGYEGRLLAESIGYTKGTGSIHLEALYPHVLDMLRCREPKLVAGGYGNGPKRKWQHFKRAMDLLNIPRDYFDHGLKREVFLYRLVTGLEAGMSGGSFGRSISLRAVDYARFWLQRWAIPRAERDETWRAFLADDYYKRAFALEDA
jgi:hypothetical protein